jgi:hypothetical protein
MLYYKEYLVGLGYGPAMQTPRRKLKGVAKDLSIITVALAHDLCEPPVVEVTIGS